MRSGAGSQIFTTKTSIAQAGLALEAIKNIVFAA
jgi:hypothetical protein